MTLQVKILVGYFVLINLVAFIAYGMDKRRARKNKWRIPEKTLLFLAMIGGSIGALLGMNIFRHKTKHWKFKVGVPLILGIQLGISVYFLIK